ncbi:Surfactin synthase subunit 2 [Cedecea neteri]|uniref:Surfactin synthase subunit 2 n=1 Tax=Cedecea neteri TaxID=158822 RepID=A0A2X2T540_9ENTR|nr:Surfactin synthase subunit 2 [Cedecea neteri]
MPGRRNDSQIKLNGYRIEINEIENRLLAMSGISEAVVLPLMKSGGGVLRIAAFCVTGLAPGGYQNVTRESDPALYGAFANHY